MITNVESLIASKRKDRFQHNMPVEFDTQGLDYYVTARLPDPGLGDAEPYNESGILPAPVDCEPVQTIVYETASSTDAVATEYRELKSAQRALRDEYRRDLKRYWSILMALPKIDKIFYKPDTRMVALKAKRLRISDGFRLVRRRVALKPRQVPSVYWETKQVFRHGKIWPEIKRYKRITLKWVTPYAYRLVRVPKYKYVTIRPAGVFPRRIRVKTVVQVRDWTTIRRKYAAYKQERVASLNPRLESINSRLTALRDAVKRRPPRLMVSWTTHGFIRPYQPGEPKPSSVYKVKGIERRPTSVYFPRTEWEFYPTSPWKRAKHGAFVFYSPGYGPIQDSGDVPVVSPAQREWFERDHHLSMTGDEIAIPRLKRGQGAYRFIERPSLEKQAMLAYSSVYSLTKAKDYQFQWFRSLVELKDTKQSLDTLKAIKQAGSGFITWVSSIQTMPVPQMKELTELLKSLSNKFGTTLRLLAAAYLTYKFAVEPTMADVDTVIKSTTDWLFEIRRALSSILTDPNSKLNTFHARAKYGDNVRELKIGRDVDLQVDDHTVEIEVPCIIRWPSFIWREIGSFPRFRDADGFTAEIVGPNHTEEDGWYDFPSVTRNVRLTADSGTFELPLSVAGLRHHSWWDKHPYEPSVTSYHHEIYGTVQPSHSVSEIENWILAKTFEDCPVVERYPAYLSTWSSGVVFGEYHLDDLLDLLNMPGSSSPALKGLLSAVYTGACDLLARLDVVKTSWELTPLSFVYDWFTDSSTLVTVLANMARSNWTIYNQTPVARYGVWESRRTELLGGTGMYRFAGCECTEYLGSSTIDYGSPDWLWAGMSPVLRPVVSHRLYKLRFEAIHDKVRLMRTGLYRVRRGEQTGYSSISSYLPKVSVSVTGGKILSLSALITSLLGGNGR